jgi:aldehyde dehydrogenase (NAD+)
VILHAGVPNAPFGGVGPSGHGSYHGVYGFKAFSHERVVVAPPTWLDRVLSFRYPPYNLSNVGKISVSNNLGFKRGEGLLDQKIKSRGLGKVIVGSLQAAAATIVLVALARLVADRKLVLEDAKSVLSRVIRDIGGRGL